MTTQTPKLLTEAEVDAFVSSLGLTSAKRDAIANFVRERGLIVEEPVDPLLVEAREIAAKYWERQGDHIGADAYRAGGKDDWASAEIALAALRRGVELAPRKELTREMVREMMIAALVSSDAVLRYEDFDEPLSNFDRRQGEATVDALHAALTEALQ